ncbi:xanthine dehydrogenase family protein molybdopterin-binding subunit [Flagellimonas nanhaiensis]|uniref:Xanthine dehydrogenase family protein molybdopterin-binding subunit n=1 Tax=Flagellimonas nanhaiensis TaxID=2292706 RepID=A0A371JUT4_9FLAO|nr:molybdopterin cofactor-binding domain-containing protein [Allomuricauda nanhaiensis]RDY61559.1 xanthine dehydrogenase family protein molybdopterin-binding subunit [Allomuricauda nanhaiensis]
MERRNFFKITSLAGGGLLLSTYLPLACTTTKESAFDWEPNFFIRIGSDNTVTFICSQSELGQGTSTGLAMVAADELGASMDTLKIEFGQGSAERYGNLQDTGGSNGLRIVWSSLREAMATTRELLIAAAAQKWQIDTDECYCEDGFIHRKNDEEKLAFGDVLDIASTLSAPREIKLKEFGDFKYIGKPIKGPKTRMAVNGTTPYSINMKLPNMLYAAIERCPVWKGSLSSFDASEALKVPGVVEVLEVEPTEVQATDYRGGVRPGVAVLATSTWAAFEGKKALKIEWEMGINGLKSSQDVQKELEDDYKTNSKANVDLQNATALFEGGRKVFSAAYDSPHQANACMEPLNATAYHRGHKVEVWAGTQSPQLTRDRIAELTELPLAAITVNNQPSGGAFGRRYFCDYVEEAVILSEKVRVPVKVTWSREDTFLTSKYHPICKDYWQASLDTNNFPTAIKYRGSISRPGGYRCYPYSVPIAFYDYLKYKDDWLLPRASWRSVYAHPWGLGMECFMDELAHNAQEDPLQFRIKLLENAKIVEQKALPWVGDDFYPEKLKNTLEMVAEKSNWGKKSEGIYQGVSAISYNTSYCSMVADISMTNNQVKVHKVTAVIDCGLAVNPSQVKAQIEGSILWGLSATLKDAITVEHGHVQQSNYDTYDLMRISDAPEIDVHIVESTDTPSGTGEVGVPGVAPAVLNAVYAATGKRIRQLPIRSSLLQSTDS